MEDVTVEVLVGEIDCLADSIFVIDLAVSGVVISEAVAVKLGWDVAAVKVVVIEGYAVELCCLADDLLAVELVSDVAVPDVAVDKDGMSDAILAVEFDSDVDRSTWVGL